MEQLIVDGYNILNSWPELVSISKNDLESARNKLLEVLSNYQGYKKIKIMIVYDAHLVKGGREIKETYGAVEVVYTKENETADHYIEKLVHKIGRTKIVKVATSDYLEQSMILGGGATRLSANELRREVIIANSDISNNYLQPTIKNHTIGSRLHKDVLETLEKLRRHNL